MAFAYSFFVLFYLFFLHILWHNIHTVLHLGLFFFNLTVLLDLFYQYIKSFLIFYSCTIVQHMFIS